MNRFAIAAAALAVLASPMMAQARDTSMKLDLKGVDTHTQAGAQEALARIAKAAAKACELNATGTRMSKADAQCVSDLTRQAVASVNSTELTALYKTPAGGLDASDPSNGRMKGVR